MASTAILVSQPNTDDQLIDTVLTAIYDTNLRAHFPLMMTPTEVKSWSLFPLKPASLQYLDPYSGLGIFANFAESLAAIKELLFALIAATYFSWIGYRKHQQKKVEQDYHVMKEKLDVFLVKTVRIEEKVSREKSVDKLEALLDQTTQIKFKAIKELTHEDLRGDNLFGIFLMQTNALIQRIQNKIQLAKQV